MIQTEEKQVLEIQSNFVLVKAVYGCEKLLYYILYYNLNIH